jgi:hypothetical protein
LQVVSLLPESTILQSRKVALERSL